MNGKKYITTTLPYINSKPHLGHALELVEADVMARAYKKLGVDVFFNTGTDENGTKIQQTAEQKGLDTQEYADTATKWFKELVEELNIKPTRFIRTTEKDHKEKAQEFWRRCNEKGYIYKKEFSGKYCVGCEMFKSEKEINDGECALHEGKKLEEVSETNYFFKLSEFQNKLGEYLKGDTVLPARRKNELLELLNNGLEDISISREKKRVKWGIDVPGDDEQLMYVWFDALTNYINTLGWPDDPKFKEFWPGIQIAGKDNMRQQAIIWQAMLMSLEIPTTEKIYIHGFITKDGKKMSKTTGNVIEPKEIIDKYGAEFLRYFLIAHIHPFEDSDITDEKLEKAYQSDLVRSIGNIVSRVMQMSEDTLEETPKLEDKITDEIYKKYINFEFQSAIAEIQKNIKLMDKLIDTERPFEEEDITKKKKIIKELVIKLFIMACDFEPVMPETSAKIKNIIKSNKKPEPLFNKEI